MPRQFLVYDTESTGLKFAETDLSVPASLRHRGDEVCQIGGLLLDERMEPTKLFCHYCDTVKVDCDPTAQKVNGIYMEEVRKYVRCQYLPQVLQERVPEFFADDIIFIGYNVEFDQRMVGQTLSNSDVSFTWSPFKGSIIPKTGRWSVDVSDFFKRVASGNRSYRQHLSSFVQELEGPREEFFQCYGAMEVETNCLELLAPSWKQAHNSFFDALNTFLLWRDRIWRKKLL